MEKNKAPGRKTKPDRNMRALLIGNEVPKSAYVLALLLYFIASIILARAARSERIFHFFGMDISAFQFTGVFSALANICIMFLVIMFKKIGYLTSMIILLTQFPLLCVNIFVRHVEASIPGFCTNLFTILAITLIFINNERVDKYQKKMRHQAVTDDLTELPNRFACNEVLSNLEKYGDRFTVLSINLNNFKNINDTMGHDTGDKVLVEIADRWRKLMDSKSTGTDDFVARMTGDDFVIIIGNYESESDVEKTIQDYKDELERKMTIDDCDYFMLANYGYAMFPEDADKKDLVISYSGAAMHEAKRLGITGTAIKFKSEFMKSEQTLEIERKIRSALDENKITFHLQPQYDMNHKLRGFEALARMKDSDGSYISPADFIPVAEKTGLIDKVDNRVFVLAVEFLEKMKKEKNSDLVMSVNVSVRHLMRNNFLDELRGVLESHDVSPSNIEIEITESIMIDSVEKALQCIKEIKDMGMKIAIDDFGTGYSSLSYLNNFPADMLKIDKSFIDVMNNDKSSTQYVATIISIGHILNLKVISEGVENQEQIDTLRSNGCDYIQGFIWGKPLPPEEAEKLVS